MVTVKSELKAYLYELYSRTKGDTEARVSMYDVGASLGLNEENAGDMGESLLEMGLAELKTLSGGIGITREGLTVLDVVPEVGKDQNSFRLGNEIVLKPPGIEYVNQVVNEIKETLPTIKLSYDSLDEAVTDIKTIDVQMLSPSPKTAVIREVLRSLSSIIASSGPRELATRLDDMISAS